MVPTSTVGARPCGVEQRFGKEGGGGFAVGASDAGWRPAHAPDARRMLPPPAPARAAHVPPQARAGRARYTGRWSKVGAESVMMPSAPAAMALSTYLLPSVDPPFMATKTEPGRTRRESYSMPVIGASEAAGCAYRPSISSVSSFQFMSEFIVVCWGVGSGVRR